MRILELSLSGFRNYEEVRLRLDPGVNLLLGENAQGKTNLLEAVTYLSAGRSFRSRKETELIGFGREFAELSATVFSGQRERDLRILLFSGRKKRQLFLSGVKKKTFGELSGVLTSVLFCPEDLLILKTGSTGRRRMMDQALCQLSPSYDHALSEYTRLLEHKGRILKDRFDDPSLLDLLPEFNEQLCRYGSQIIHARGTYMAMLSPEASQFHRAFSGDREELSVTYRTVSTVSDPTAPAETIYGELREHLTAHWQVELDSCQCLTGPHRDDFEAEINGVSVKSFGSQGQTRTAAISLKLAERELFRRTTGEEPVLLLDDVLSELDGSRQDFVLNHLNSGQVFITCCETDRLTDIGKTFLVEHGAVRG